MGRPDSPYDYSNAAGVIDSAVDMKNRSSVSAGGSRLAKNSRLINKKSSNKDIRGNIFQSARQLRDQICKVSDIVMSMDSSKEAANKSDKIEIPLEINHACVNILKEVSGKVMPHFFCLNLHHIFLCRSLH